MKKVFFATCIFLALAIVASAQSGPRGEQAKEEIESYKIAFFTKKLQLTPDESKDFWPLYNQFQKEQETLKDKYGLRGKRLELMSDNEVEDFVDGQIQMAEDQAKIRRDYVERFKEILPIRKVAMLQHIDREFKKELLEEIRKRRQQRQGQNGGRPRGGNR